MAQVGYSDDNQKRAFWRVGRCRDVRQRWRVAHPLSVQEKPVWTVRHRRRRRCQPSIIKTELVLDTLSGMTGWNIDGRWKEVWG